MSVEKNVSKDSVNHPAHYADRKIEVIEFIEDSGWGRGFCLGNAVKYIARAGKKDPSKEIEDLEKARWYLDRQIEILKSIREARPLVRPNDMSQTCQRCRGTHFVPTVSGSFMCNECHYEAR